MRFGRSQLSKAMLFEAEHYGALTARFEPVRTLKFKEYSNSSGPNQQMLTAPSIGAFDLIRQCQVSYKLVLRSRDSCRASFGRQFVARYASSLFAFGRKSRVYLIESIFGTPSKNSNFASHDSKRSRSCNRDQYCSLGLQHLNSEAHKQCHCQ